MSETEDNKPKKKGIFNPKGGEEVSRFKKESIIMDFKAGLRNSEIAKRNGVSVQYVSQVQNKNRAEIKAHFDELLAVRQRKIDEFLERNQDDMMDVIEQASEILKTSLSRHKEKLAIPDQAVPTEIRHKNSKGQYVKGVPADNLLQAMELWQKAMSVFVGMQRVGDD